MLLISPPLSLALAPFFTYATHHAARHHASTLLLRLPGFLRFIGERAAWFAGVEGTHTALSFAAISELMAGSTAPLLLLSHGLRAGVVVVFYFTHLAKSHKTSWYTRTAVEARSQ